VLNGRFKTKAGGAYDFVENFPARYIADLTKRDKIKRHLKVVCACGNGTAGAFAPQVLQKIGCEVVRSTASSITRFQNTIRTPKT